MYMYMYKCSYCDRPPTHTQVHRHTGHVHTLVKGISFITIIVLITEDTCTCTVYVSCIGRKRIIIFYMYMYRDGNYY